MKKLKLLIAFVLLGFAAFAQQTLTIPYQALVRDANGNPVASRPVGAKITLLQGSVSGLMVYDETQTDTTNAFGQMDLLIGTQKPADFDTINWSAEKMFLKLEIDISGGTTYQQIATHQLLAVPFAKYAEEAAGWKKSNHGISFKSGNVQIGDSIFDADLSVQGNIFFQDTSFISSNGQDLIRNYIQSALMDTEQYYGYVQGLKVYSSLEQNSTIGASGNNKYIMSLISQQDIFGKLYGDSYGIWARSQNRPNGIVNGTSYSVAGSSRNDGYISGDLIGVYGSTINSGTVDGKMWAGYFNGNGYVSGNLSVGTTEQTSTLFVNGNTRIGPGGYFHFHNSNEFNANNGAIYIQHCRGSDNSATNAGNTIINGNSGSVLIGTTTVASGYKVNVNGKIKATNLSLKFDASGTFFKQNKAPTNLKKLEDFIRDNHHLPEMESAIASDSIVDIQQMNLFFINKLEELTLYIIQQQKEIETQKSFMESQIEFLKSEIENIRNK